MFLGIFLKKGICLETGGIIEPNEQLIERKRVLSGRVLTKASEIVPVRLMNPTDSPVVIRKGTTIGMFEPVDDMKENHSQHNEGRNTKELPAQLQMLLNKSSKYLDRTQKYKLKETLGCITRMYLL